MSCGSFLVGRGLPLWFLCGFVCCKFDLYEFHNQHCGLMSLWQEGCCQDSWAVTWSCCQWGFWGIWFQHPFSESDWLWFGVWVLVWDISLLDNFIIFVHSSKRYFSYTFAMRFQLVSVVAQLQQFNSEWDFIMGAILYIGKEEFIDMGAWCLDA